MQPTNTYEQERVASVKSYRVKSGEMQELDRLTALAALSCNMPVSLITLVDDKRQICLAAKGIPPLHTGRNSSFCVNALAGEFIFEVEDTLSDERFVNNPLVTGPPHIRHYAGYPIIDSKGFAIGTICVINQLPGKLSVSQREALKLLASEVMGRLQSKKQEQDLAHYERLFNLSTDLLCISGQNKQFKKVNPAFGEILGWSNEEALSRPIPLFVHPDDRENSQKEVDRFLTGEKRVQFTNRFIDSKGEYRLFDWLTNFDANTSTMYGIGRDVSRLYETERALLNTTEMLEAVSVIGVIGGWEYSVAENSFTSSKVTRQILELTDGFHSSCNRFLDYCKEGESREKADKAFNDAVEHCIPFDITLQVVTGSGKEKWVRNMGRIEAVDNKCVRLYGILQDVDDFKTIENTITLSEKRFHNIFDFSPIGMFFADAGTTRFTEANKAFLTKIGYSADELVNMSLTRIIHQSDIGAFAEKFEDLRSGKVEYINLSLRIYSKNLYAVTIELVASFIRNELGYPIMLIGHAQDITGRLDAERRLKISEETHRAFFEYTTGLMCTHDLNGVLLSMNPAAWSLLGFKAEPKAFTLYDIIAPGYKDTVPVYLENIKKRGEAEGLMHVLDRNGNERIWMFKNVVAESLSGDAYVISNGIDITQRVAMEQQLKKAKEDAQMNTRAKDIFLANMSHEIRTPINAITGFTNLLAQTNLTQQQQNFVSFITTAGENLIGIINDILDFSKVQAGSLQIEYAPFKPRDVINHVSAALKGRIIEKGLTLEVIVADEIPLELSGDALRLNQVLLNLVNNAVKFTREGFIRVSAEVREDLNDSCTVLFTVADTGIGIAPENIEMIFHQFTQADADTNREYGGTGLGLSICRSLVALHQGELWVESERGKGSTFFFTIPYKKIVQPKPKNEKLDPALLVSDKKLHILLVEDNMLNQVLVTTVLENFGFVADIAENGKEALEKLKASAYDLVIMDLQMPVMDGYEATTQIRQELKLSIPIIAMTANSLLGEKDKCLSLGMNDYIPKPFEQEELFHKILKYTGND